MKQKKPDSLFYQEKIECSDRKNECSRSKSAINKRAPDTFYQSASGKVHFRLHEGEYLKPDDMENLDHLIFSLACQFNKQSFKVVAQLFFHGKEFFQSARKDYFSLVNDADICADFFNHIQAVC